MALLTPAPCSTNAFTFNRHLGYFTADASDLQGPLFGRVWDDAADEGLTLISAKTGDAVVFVVDQRLTDSEGELLGWKLVPVHNRLPGIKVVIFND